MAAKKDTEKKPRAPKKAVSDDPIVLTWDLHELPSSQHRAGLVGLMLMVEWNRRHPDAIGICEVVAQTATSFSLRIDAAGMQSVFDDTYAASLDEVLVQQRYKNKEPKRETTVEVTKKNTKGEAVTKTETRYVYDQVVPRGAWLTEVEVPSPEGKTPWTKLWRDFVWSILRGVPATRGPFEARADKSACTDGIDCFAELQKNEDAALDLPSTYSLGAQSRSADFVDVLDRARYRLLLHFWPFVARIYIPTVVDSDGKSEFVGFAVGVPDVSDLRSFETLLRASLLERAPQLAGFRPRGALIDLPDEAGLDLLRGLRDRVAVTEGSDDRISSLVSGVDVIHCEKEGNNVRVRSISRVIPKLAMIDEYARVRANYWSPLFRRTRIANVLRERPWWSGFDRLFMTESWKRTIDDHAFAHDAREAFQHGEVSMTDENKKTLEGLVYQAIGTYVFGRLSSKHGLEWKDVGDNAGKKKDYEEKKEKVARDAFLAVRARTGADFVAYFTGTLCSVPQHLGEDGYAQIARELLTNPERIRTLTLLALSARG